MPSALNKVSGAKMDLEPNQPISKLRLFFLSSICLSRQTVQDSIRPALSLFKTCKGSSSQQVAKMRWISWCHLFDARLTAGWPNFVNNTNSCSQCDVLFQSQDKLAFHIGAKHNEVESILEAKGIPIPKDVALPSNLNKGPVENLETHPTPSAVPGVSISAPLNLAPVPNPGSPPGPGNAPGPENVPASATGPENIPASAPGPGNATGPGNMSKGAAGWSCAGVNYDLHCEVWWTLKQNNFSQRSAIMSKFHSMQFCRVGNSVRAGVWGPFPNPPPTDPALHNPFHPQYPGEKTRWKIWHERQLLSNISAQMRFSVLIGKTGKDCQVIVSSYQMSTSKFFDNVPFKIENMLTGVWIYSSEKVSSGAPHWNQAWQGVSTQILSILLLAAFLTHHCTYLQLKIKACFRWTMCLWNWVTRPCHAQWPARRRGTRRSSRRSWSWRRRGSWRWKSKRRRRGPLTPTPLLVSPDALSLWQTLRAVWRRLPPPHLSNNSSQTIMSHLDRSLSGIFLPETTSFKLFVVHFVES